MEKLVFEDDIKDDAFEEKLRDTAAKRLLQLNIPPFIATDDMKLVRSESEIAKCVEKAEREKRKKFFAISDESKREGPNRKARFRNKDNDSRDKKYDKKSRKGSQNHSFDGGRKRQRNKN